MLKDDHKDLKSLEEKIEKKTQEFSNEQDEEKKKNIEEELNSIKEELFTLQGKKGLNAVQVRVI